MSSCRTEAQRLISQDFLEAAKNGDLEKVNAYITMIRDNPDALNINTTNEFSGNTALILASGFGHESVVRALLAVPGIDITKKNNTGVNALAFAKQKRQHAIVTLLNISRSEVSTNTSTISPDEYFHAAKTGDAAKVRQYILANISNRDAINIRHTESQDTALTFAAKYGRENVINVLVETGLADLNAVNRQGHTAATLAQMNNHFDIAESLTALAQVTPVNDASSQSASVSSSSAMDIEEDQPTSSEHSLNDYICPVSQMVFFNPVLLNPCEHPIERDFAYGENGAPKLEKCPCCRAAISGSAPASPALEIENIIQSELVKNPKLHSKCYFNPKQLENILKENALETPLAKKIIQLLENATNHLIDAFTILSSNENGRELLEKNEKIRARISSSAVLRQMHLASVVNTGDLEKLKTLIAGGADINTVLGLLISKHKSAVLWWLHTDKSVRDSITAAGIQAVIPEGKDQGKTVAEALVNSKKGCQLLIEDERLQSLYPAELNGKTVAELLNAKKAEPNFSQAGFFASPLTSDQQTKKNEAKQAKKLLECVLFPITYNIEKIIEAAKNQPQLFFIKATAQDQAKDLAGNTRTIVDWSPYQAMFGTSDTDLLSIVKPHLDAYLNTLPNGNDLAATQKEEKFPNGFDFPPSTYDFNPLVTAINEDQQLKQTGVPSPGTLALLSQLQAAFKPGTVKVGHHFNMNDMIKIHEIYDHYFDPWNTTQLKFYSVHVIGFLERLMAGCYLQASTQGLDNHVNKKVPLKRDYEVMNYATGNMEVVAPLDRDTSCRLGQHFVVDSYFGAARAGLVSMFPAAGLYVVFKTYVEQKQQTCRTYAATTTRASSGIALRNDVR